MQACNILSSMESDFHVRLFHSMTMRVTSEYHQDEINRYEDSWALIGRFSRRFSIVYRGVCWFILFVQFLLRDENYCENFLSFYFTRRTRERERCLFFRQPTSKQIIHKHFSEEIDFPMRRLLIFDKRKDFWWEYRKIFEHRSRDEKNGKEKSQSREKILLR